MTIPTRPRRGWAAALALVCAAATSVSGQNPTPAAAAQAASNAAALQGLGQARANLEDQIRQATRALRAEEAKGPLTPEANRRYYDLLGRYRQIVAAELVAKTAGLSPADQSRTVSQALGDVNSALSPITSDAAMKALADKVASAGGVASMAQAAGSSFATKEQAYAGVEAEYTLQRTRAEVTREMQRRLDLAQLRMPTGTRRGRTGPDTVPRLQELLNSIVNVNVEAPRLPSWVNPDSSTPTSVQRQVEEFRRRLQRDADIAEYMRLAESGLLVDADGHPISGDQRQRIASNAKLQLAEALRVANIDLGVFGTLFGWNDQRGAVGTQIQTGVTEDNAYQVLRLIDPSTQGASPQQWARGMAEVIRYSADRVHAWRSDQIPDGGNGGVSGWLYENFWAKQQVGLATATDLIGYNAKPGEARTGVLAQVDDRIAAFEKDADAAVAALNAMASATSPTQLAADQLKLLEQFGFVTKGPDGTYTFTVPSNANVTGQLQQNLNLPGASILNVISAGNAIKTVLLMAAPEMAAARVGVILSTLGASERAIAVGEFVTTALTNAALDAAQQKIQVGTVQWDRLVLDTVVLNTVLPIASQATGAAANVLAGRIANSKATKEAVESLLTQSLGLSTDTALLTYWQGLEARGGGMTYEDFLANAFNGLVMRGAPALGRTATGSVRTLWDLVRGVNPELQKELASRTHTPEEIAALVESGRFKEQQQQYKDAGDRLQNVLGDEYLRKDLSDPDLIAKVTEAAETGKLGFADLKAVFGDKPELQKLMDGVNQYRLRTFDAIIATAQTRARADVNVEYDGRAARLKEHLTGTDQLDKALAANEAERQAELNKIDEPPKAPGSKNVTSDIDRSISSAYLRNELKAATDEAFRRNRPGADPATSAKAYDVNEYFDIFQVINRMRDAGIDLSGVTLNEPGVGSVTQTDAIVAAGLAASMQDMSPAQRAAFRKNRTATGDPARLGRLFDLAEQRLARDQALLNQELATLGAQGFDTTNPDVITRARDNVYGRRAAELAQMEATLKRMDAGSDAYKELAARIEREWSYVKLAGIEAYTNFTGLDIIVNKAQMNDISIRELITGKADPAQTGKVNKGRAEKGEPAVTGEARQALIDKTLADIKAQYGPAQLTGALDDQIRFMVDHLNGYFEGHESATQAGTALSKYAERASLLLKLSGADMTQGALKQLDDIGGILVKVRGDPKALTDALATFGGGDADAGLRKLSDLLSTTLPGLKGVFDAGMFAHGASPTGGAGGTATAGGTIDNSASLNQWLRFRALERQRLAANYGAAVVVASIVNEQNTLQTELDKLQKEQADDARLAPTYRQQDFGEVRRLEDEAKAIQQQIDNLPATGTGSQVRKDLDQKAADVKNSLTRIQGYKTATGPSAPTPYQQWRERRIASIKAQLEANAAAANAYAQLAQVEATRLAGLGGGFITGGPSGGLEGVTSTTETGYTELNKLGAALRDAFEQDATAPVPPPATPGASGQARTATGQPATGCTPGPGRVCGTPDIMRVWDNPNQPIFSGLPVRTSEDITTTAQLLGFVRDLARQAVAEKLVTGDRTVSPPGTTASPTTPAPPTPPPTPPTSGATGGSTGMATPTGSIMIHPNGVGALTVPGASLPYPMTFGPNGGFMVYAPGTNVATGTAGSSAAPIAITLPPLLPGLGALTKGDGTVTYSGVPLSGFPGPNGVGPMSIDLGSLVFKPPEKGKTPGTATGGGDSSSSLAVDSPGDSNNLGEEKGMGWGEHGSFIPNPDPRTTTPPSPLEIFDLGTNSIGPDTIGPTLPMVQIFVATLDGVTVPAATAGREPSPGGLWSWIRALVDPRAGTSEAWSVRSRFMSPVPPRMRSSSVAGGPSAPDAPALDAVFVSTGLATGRAFQVTAVNGGPRALELQADAVVLEPLAPAAGDRVAKAMQDVIKQRGSKAPAPSVAPVNGYCLEYHKPPPAAGSLFRVAAPEVQARFAELERVLQAEERLEQLGKFVPDSDPTQYFHSLRQWALWSKAEGFTEQAFAKEFVDHARLNSLAAKAPWTSQIASQIAGLVPHRWQEIAMVLQEAGKRQP